MALKLVVIAGDRSGPFYHDFGVPFQYYEKYGLIDPLAIDHLFVDPLRVADVIHFQRQYAPESLLLMRNMKKRKKACIFHCDDNVWELPPNNPAIGVYKGRILEFYQTILHEAHAVTTSTPYLKKLCERFNPNVYIFRNLVESKIEEFLTPGRDNPEEIRIGWTGTPHHHDDILPMEPIFPELVKDSRVKLVFMGYAPPTVLHHIHRSRWEYYDFVPVDSFYPALANLDFDIGIAPLIENGFNKGKTARKAQEYAILRAPMCLAPVTTYRDWINGEVCTKPSENTPEAWYKILRFMIDHPEERDRLQKAAYAQVKRNHDIDTYIQERAGIYYQIYEKVQSGEYK